MDRRFRDGDSERTVQGLESDNTEVRRYQEIRPYRQRCDARGSEHRYHHYQGWETFHLHCQPRVQLFLLPGAGRAAGHWPQLQRAFREEQPHRHEVGWSRVSVF